MLSPDEIRALRSGKGYFTRKSILEALEAEGVKMTANTYASKEKGKAPFTVKEIRALVKILGITIEEGVEFFS